MARQVCDGSECKKPGPRRTGRPQGTGDGAGRDAGYGRDGVIVPFVASRLPLLPAKRFDSDRAGDVGDDLDRG